MHSRDVSDVCAAAIFTAETLKMEAACSSETLVTTNKVTWCHNLDHNLNYWHHRNLKSHMPEDDILRTVILQTRRPQPTARVPSVARGTIFNGTLSELKYSI
jgi:hypothetical protein